MIDSKEYYKNTLEANNISAILRKFYAYKYNEKLEGNTAIDLGCGAGNDTLFLLDKGFKVIAIDIESKVKDILEEKVEKNENLEIIIKDFSKIELPKADLIHANFSLFFVKDNLAVYINNILNCINKKGFFIGNFLGEEDEWAGKDKATVNKEELLKYFENCEMFYFSDEKYYKDGVSVKNKFWHIYTIIAQKK